MDKHRESLNALLDTTEPDGSVFVFLDESYEPFVAAAAVVVESNCVAQLDSDIAATYERVQDYYYLGGMPSFEEFRERGFHATSDPMEVRIAFVAFLAQALSFKSLIVYSDRSLNAEMTDKQRLIVVFDQLLRDVLGAYRSRPKIIFCFESARGMDQYLERLVMRNAQSLGRRRPEVAVYFGTKQNPHLLALPDYVLHIFNKWVKPASLRDYVLDPKDHRDRSFRAILGSMSVARLLDNNGTVRRALL